MSFGGENGPHYIFGGGYIGGWHETLANEAISEANYRKWVKRMERKMERKKRFWAKFGIIWDGVTMKRRNVDEV